MKNFSKELKSIKKGFWFCTRWSRCISLPLSTAKKQPTKKHPHALCIKQTLNLRMVEEGGRTDRDLRIQETTQCEFPGLSFCLINPIMGVASYPIMGTRETGNPEMSKGIGRGKKAQRKDFLGQRTRKEAAYQDRIVLDNNCTPAKGSEKNGVLSLPTASKGCVGSLHSMLTWL